MRAVHLTTRRAIFSGTAVASLAWRFPGAKTVLLVEKYLHALANCHCKLKPLQLRQRLVDLGVSPVDARHARPQALRAHLREGN